MIGLDDREGGETVIIFIIAFRGEDGINKMSSCFMSLCLFVLFCLVFVTSAFFEDHRAFLVSHNFNHYFGEFQISTTQMR